MKRFTETAVGSTGYVAAKGYTPPKGNTVATSGYISTDICEYRLPCGLCRRINEPCPMMRQTEYSEVTCSNMEVE